MAHSLYICIRLTPVGTGITTCKMNQTIYRDIKSLCYWYKHGHTQWHGANSIWRIDWWDGRTAVVKRLKQSGINRVTAAGILAKICRRSAIRNESNTVTREDRIAFIRLANKCAFDLNATSSRYNCTGIDWKAFHRPSSNGKGWVLIAPDEPDNNWYIEDELILRYLTKKFLAGLPQVVPAREL